MKRAEEIRSQLLDFVRDAYPNMTVDVKPESTHENQFVITFVEQKFAELYPWQRYHYLSHLIPEDYRENYIRNSVWIELAPGECSEDIESPDEEFIASIAPDVLKYLSSIAFFDTLDNILCPTDQASTRVPCCGDFRNSKSVLRQGRVEESDFSDIFHVLMNKGGFCDCEVLYNLGETSRLRAEYWRARAKGRTAYDPHKRN